MQIVPPTPEGLATAADGLRRGVVVAYPTETVYGFGVDPFSESAIRRLYAIKERDPRNPVLLIVGSFEQLKGLVSEDSGRAMACARAFWPGPLSILFPTAAGVPEWLCGEDGRVCVRYTSSEIARGLCEAFGGALVSTSANRSGARPAVSLEEIEPAGIGMGIDGGVIEGGLPSTVFDPEMGEVLREGAVPKEELLKRWEQQ